VLATWLGALPLTPEPAETAATTSAPVRTTTVASATSATSTSAPPAVEARGWWLGAGLGAIAGSGVVPGARAELARIRPSGDGIGFVVALQAALPRDREIGGGTSRWVRPAVGVAGTASWRLGRVAVAADLGPLASVTVAWGSGYPHNRYDRALVLGFSAGLRLLLGPGPSRPWIELRAAEWFGTQRLRFDSAAGEPVTAELPSLEGLITLGWSLPL
jgi:hypothetical protein